MLRRKRRVMAGIGKHVEEGERGMAAGMGGFIGESASMKKMLSWMQEWESVLRREKEAEWQQE